MEVTTHDDDRDRDQDRDRDRDHRAPATRRAHRAGGAAPAPARARDDPGPRAGAGRSVSRAVHARLLTQRLRARGAASVSTLATAILDLLRAGHVVTVDQIGTLLHVGRPAPPDTPSWGPPRAVVLQALVDLVASGQARTVWDGGASTRYAITAPPGPGRNYAGRQRAERAVNRWRDHLGCGASEDHSTDEWNALRRIVEEEI